ncbi:hypothetical protein [Microbacterium elymi]|uniref:Uncharacterized protein n=1 Tax=Microbacterium elymi TaxID=2909587 RepID=A0ABY5NJR5_9MICO|nr:hypothetical protein [Microbacterium elymi]UUT35403.1 hypothetical protein L2X98_18480 [Microbacterium elymi]
MSVPVSAPLAPDDAGRRGRPVAPGWRDLVEASPAARSRGTALALGVELRQRHPRGRTQWAPRRVETATARSIATVGGELLVGLRPLERSTATGNWIRGEASWDAIRRGGPGFDPAHTRWLAELAQHRARHRLAGAAGRRLRLADAGHDRFVAALAAPGGRRSPRHPRGAHREGAGGAAGRHGDGGRPHRAGGRGAGPVASDHRRRRAGHA